MFEFCSILFYPILIVFFPWTMLYVSGSAIMALRFIPILAIFSDTFLTTKEITHCTVVKKNSYYIFLTLKLLRDGSKFEINFFPLFFQNCGIFGRCLKLQFTRNCSKKIFKNLKYQEKNSIRYLFSIQI